MRAAVRSKKRRFVKLKNEHARSRKPSAAPRKMLAAPRNVKNLPVGRRKKRLVSRLRLMPAARPRKKLPSACRNRKRALMHVRRRRVVVLRAVARCRVVVH